MVHAPPSIAPAPSLLLTPPCRRSPLLTPVNGTDLGIAWRLFVRVATDVNGVIDFAGSGVVHMVGGWSALMAAIAAGPRIGRFVTTGETGKRRVRSDAFVGANPGLVAAGALMLWFAWYAFNIAPALALVQRPEITGRVAINTTISAAAAAIVGTVVLRLYHRSWQPLQSMHCALAGLASISACCATVEPWGALLSGIVGAVVYLLGSKMLIRLGIDDPLDAASVHGFAGTWGLLASGIFSRRDLVMAVYGEFGRHDSIGNGEQFGMQLLAALVIMIWTVVTSGVLFFSLRQFDLLRTDDSTQMHGAQSPEATRHLTDVSDDEDDVEKLGDRSASRHGSMTGARV